MDELPKAIAAHPESYAFLENGVLDNLVSTMIELSAQVWTLKRRLLVTESLLESKGLASAAEIETFVPSAEDEAAWQAERDRYIQAVFASFARTIPLDTRPKPDSFLRR